MRRSTKQDHKIRSFFKELWTVRDLLILLIQKNVKLKYRRSFLGYIWSILNPLLVMLVMVVVFSSLFRREIENYPVYLFTGQLLFSFMTTSTQTAANSIIENSGMLRKARTPKHIFTIAKVTGAAVELLFSTGALIIIMLATKAPFSWCMLLSPLVLLQLYIFCIGLGLFLAQACVFFQDIGFIYRAFTTMWMYLTPLFYPIEALPQWAASIIRTANPMYLYINQFRSLVYLRQMPKGHDVLMGCGFALVFLFLGIRSFTKTEDKFIFYI